MNLPRKLLLPSLLTLILTACGGGGGGSSTPTVSNTAPVASAGADQTVDEQTSVSLDGSGSSDAEGDTLTYSWSQTAGVSVTLSGASTVQASFVGPDVGIGSTTVLSFQLTVSDGRSNHSDSIDVTVTGVSNTDAVVDAGADATVTELSTVTLSGSATDADIGDTLSYAWTQTGGPTVSINDSTMLTASFDAPDVTASGATLTFQLAVNDGTSTVTDTVVITVQEAPAAVTISGNVYYEFVPPRNNCQGSDFAATQTRPIRAVPVQLIDAGSGNVVASTVASESGAYSFAGVATNTQYRLRVRAELKKTGALPNWDVEVRDNVDTSASPPPLAQRPLYVLEGSDFNSGATNMTRDLTATTGFDSSINNYPASAVRAAAPFAIIDAVYSAIQFVVSGDPSANFAPLDMFWSVNNTSAGTSDIDAGELTGSFYRGDLDSLFLVGDSTVDADEFDDHVTVHEWGHYFEDNFSRSDSIGGPHALGERVDARLAWGEGWATAFAAMALDDPQYCDTSVVGSASGFGINAESDNFGTQGWFNEISVVTFLYDLWDTDNDASDTGSIGWQPIYNTMVGPQVSTEAFTTVFSFATELRASLNAGDASFMDTMLGVENIDAVGLDIWASNETNDVGGGRDVLPLYTDITANGSTINICTNSDYDNDRDGNKLAQDRYLRISVPTTGFYNVTITTTTPTPPTTDPAPTPPDVIRDQSDPDMYIYRNGALVAFGRGADDNSEVFTTQSTLLAGEVYVAYVEEFRFEDDSASSDFPDQICFDVTMAL